MNAAFSSTAPMEATAFLRRVSHRRAHSKGPVDSISEYIERAAMRFRDEDLDALYRSIPELRERLSSIAQTAAEFPNLPGQLALLANVLEDAKTGTFGPISDALRREASFALFYFMNEAGIIPDNVPEIGFADDSIIIRSVLYQHIDVLTEYCHARPNPTNNLTLDA